MVKRDLQKEDFSEVDLLPEKRRLFSQTVFQARSRLFAGVGGSAVAASIETQTSDLPAGMAPPRRATEP